MRLFVAVDVGAAAGRADALLTELRSRAARLAPRARVAWVPAERLHLTLRFIGNADRERTAAIQAAMAPPVDVPPFDLTFEGLGAFPRSGKPQVLWVGVSSGEPLLQWLEREITARLIPLHVAPEGRPYRPHLTIARVRDAAGLRAATLYAGLEQTSLGMTRCEAITLYESRLSPTGPTYLPLLRTALQG